LVDAIETRHEWNDTLVVITSDHGEQLGDHGLIQKLGFFLQSYHVLGLWRSPFGFGREDRQRIQRKRGFVAIVV
jgi:arylsulfatase A-like enzyme